MKRHFASVLCLLLLLLTPACAPKITEFQRKQAANLMSEAQFAGTLRDWPRAEGLMAQAAELCPDNGEYWLNLGSVRRRLDNLAGARKAYEHAVKAYGEAYKADGKDPQPLMQQIYTYSLLGRHKDAVRALERVHADHGGDPGVKSFTEQSLERMREDPAFKALAL